MFCTDIKGPCQTLTQLLQQYSNIIKFGITQRRSNMLYAEKMPWALMQSRKSSERNPKLDINKSINSTKDDGFVTPKDELTPTSPHISFLSEENAFSPVPIENGLNIDTELVDQTTESIYDNVYLI